jgi:ferric-dicitrate binding protein FerR (iron transport regulator)
MSAFDKVVREARRHFGTEEAESVDWGEIDRGLFERIAEERRSERARYTPRTMRAWPGVALAAAAAAVVFVVSERDGRRARVADVAPSVDEIAGTLVSIDGDGQVRVGGAPVARGALLRAGDVIEARGAQATIERAGKLTLRIEAGSRATVTHTQGALVLALAEGAVEAQVVPVASGEAFAVDVDGSRVAVHGTHLRVARDGAHVAVDLSEGVVSVGQAPRVGSVLGTLVTAPGHAEFVATNPSDTLTVTHDPSAVRSPVTLASAAQGKPSPMAQPLFSTSRSEPSAPLHPPAAVVPGSPHADAHPTGEPQPGVPADVHPEDAISNAVRACMAERPRAENVTVVVRTTLHLELADDGAVRAARFDPPVAPDVNTCAAASIYKVHFAHGGTQAIAIDFEN